MRCDWVETRETICGRQYVFSFASYRYGRFDVDVTL